MRATRTILLGTAAAIWLAPAMPPAHAQGTVIAQAPAPAPSDVDPRLAAEVGVLLDDLGIGVDPWHPEMEARDGD